MADKQIDELDLQKLFYDIVITIKNYNKLILACCIIGILAGVAYSLLSKKVYESKMLVSSSLLSLTYADEVLGNINLIIAEKNTERAAAELNLSQDVVKKIAFVDIESALDDKAEQLKENEKIFLRITAKTTDPSIFPELQKGLIYYLENNQFVKVRIEQRKRYYKELISKVNSELKDLEEFKQRLLKGDFFEAAKGNLMFDPTIVNSKILELTKEKINYENSLMIADNIQLINGFTASSQPRWPKKTLSIITGAFFGLFLAAIIIVFRLLNSKIKTIEGKDIQTPA